MIDIVLGFSIFSLLLLWIVALSTKKTAGLSKISSYLLQLIIYRAGIIIIIYFYIILNSNKNFNQTSYILLVLDNPQASVNLIIEGLLVISLFGLTYTLLLTKVIKISETAAKYYLDALPGKLMKIDNNLISKVICEDEAKIIKGALRNTLDAIGFLDNLSRFTRGVFMINIILTSAVLVFMFLNIINQEIGLIIRVNFLFYLIPTGVHSLLSIHLVKKLNIIFDSE